MIRQIYYTSCQHGRDGIQGFQVAAATAGIPPGDENRSLPLALYRPPPSMPPVPSPAEVAGLPVALGYRDFGDVEVLFRSSYVGQDYTGRQGNYFAHILLADEPGDLAELIPAAAWEAATWSSELGDGNGNGTELPAVAAVAPGVLADGGAVRTWLDHGTGPFAQLVSAVREALAGRLRKIVVVAGGPEPDAEVATAVLAVTAVLPARLARRVSFTTFSAAPSDADLLVVGTTTDIPITASRGETVVRLDGTGEEDVAPFAALAVHCHGAGPGAVAALRAVAAEVVPPLEPDDLDAFAAAARLLESDPDTDVLAGMEFVADRLPARLHKSGWTAVDAALEAGTVRPIDDLGRWSELLRRTTGHSAILGSSYLHAVLTSVAGGLDGRVLWLPEAGRSDVDGGGWVDVVVSQDAGPEVVGSMLETLHRLGVETRDEDLDDLVERVLLPLVLSPDGDITAVRRFPGSRRLAEATIARLESRLEDDLLDTAVESMSVDAARWLAASAEPGTRCALVTAAKLASVGEGDPVEVIASTATDAPALDRLVELMWHGPPPAASGVLLLARLRGDDVLAASSLPASLADRLVVDARDKRTGADQVELARALDQLGEALDEHARHQVDAALSAAYFREGPPSDPETLARATAAAACAADPALVEPLARLVVAWAFACGEALTHADVLGAALTEGSVPVLHAYQEQLARTLGAADPEGILAILPAIVHLSATRQRAVGLLNDTCAEALSSRKRKTLDDFERRLSEVGSVPADLRPGRAANWSAWWANYRAKHLSAGGLRERLLRFGRDG